MEKFEPTLETEKMDEESNIEELSRFEYSKLFSEFELANDIDKIKKDVADKISELESVSELSEKSKDMLIFIIAYEIKEKNAINFEKEKFYPNNDISLADKYNFSQYIYNMNISNYAYEFFRGVSNVYFNGDETSEEVDKIRENTGQARESAYKESVDILSN